MPRLLFPVRHLLDLLLVLLLAIVLDASTLVSAHGYLASPKSRNLLAAETLGWSCPHCLNLGGVDVVSDSRTLVWPQGLRTLSGDPISAERPRAFEAGGEYYVPNYPAAGEVDPSLYVAGTTLPITIVTTTNHNGRFSFRICRISGGYDNDTAITEANALTEACLDENILVQADDRHAQQPGERYFYTPLSDAGKSVEYTMYYQLPDDLECDGRSSHCVLQWYWLTFNSCQTADAPVKFTRSYNNMSNCEDPSASYPEEFANLADIRVTRSGARAMPFVAAVLVLVSVLLWG